MKALISSGKTILKALAFADVGNFRQFEELLSEMDSPSPASEQTNTKPLMRAEQKRSEDTISQQIHCAM